MKSCSEWGYPRRWILSDSVRTCRPRLREERPWYLDGRPDRCRRTWALAGKPLVLHFLLQLGVVSPTTLGRGPVEQDCVRQRWLCGQGTHGRERRRSNHWSGRHPRKRPILRQDWFQFCGPRGSSSGAKCVSLLRKWFDSWSLERPGRKGFCFYPKSRCELSNFLYRGRRLLKITSKHPQNY